MASRMESIFRHLKSLKIKQLFLFYLRRVSYRFRSQRNTPLVTVVVPLYNEERFVISCLQSVRTQSYRNIECLVINDKSTDSSPEIVEEWIKSDPRFRLLHHEQNKGLAGARNTGVFAATGKYITFLDSDDYIFPNSVYYRMRELLRHQGNKEVVGAFCKLFFVPESGHSWKNLVFPHLPAPKGKVDFLSSNGECPFNAHAPLLITERVQAAGGFKESMRHGAEDWDLWVRLLRNGYSFMPSGDYGGGYRQKKKSMVRSLADHHVMEGMKILGKCHEDKVAEADIIPGAPFVFREPLSYYHYQIIRARRLVLYSTIAFMAGDQESLNNIAKQFKKGTGYFILRKISINNIINAGIARYIGDGGRRTDEAVGDAYSADKEKIKNHVINQLS